MNRKVKVAKAKKVPRKVRKEKKLNVTGYVRQQITRGLSDEKVLKKVQKLNPKWNLKMVSEIRKTTRVERLSESAPQAEDHSNNSSVFSIRPRDRVLRVYPPKKGEYPARTFKGTVSSVRDDKIFCQIFIEDARHSQEMVFDQHGVGFDNTGAFIIKL